LLGGNALGSIATKLFCMACSTGGAYEPDEV
jgi:hypothetical protein